MGHFRDTSVKNVINELNQSYFLPDIQREYVWLNRTNEKKIENLFDSILRGYPIGSFLFWKLKKNDIETNKDLQEDSEKLNFQLYKFVENYDSRKKHNEKINIEKINADDLSIVLDGQQRLTSLFIGLKGTRTLRRHGAWKSSQDAFEEKKLYLNLRYLPDDNNPDDNYHFEFLTAKSIPDIDQNNYWFKVGEILEIKSPLEYTINNKLSTREAFILEKLKNALCVENLISFFEETEKNLDKVLKIFIRVNSGGTQLSYSDLLMSILTANFSSDIRDLMNSFVDEIQEEGFNIMSRDQVLKTCFLLTESNHIFQLKNFNKNNINKIETNWTSITSAIFRAVTLLQEFGYRKRLSSAYILATLAYYFYKKSSITQEDKEEMLRFVRNAQITSYFSTSLDNTLTIVADIIKDSNSFQEINKKLSTHSKKPLKILESDVENMLYLQYGNPATLPVLQLLYPHLDYKNSTFHIDHIYPKSKFNTKNKALPTSYKDQAHNLYNLQLLQGSENIAKRAKDPEVWLAENYSQDKIKGYKERNYIHPEFNLVWEDIANFEKNRSQEILAALKKVFGF